MVKIIRSTFVTLFYFILRICKRALCCFKRRRRMSGEPSSLTNIGIVSNKEKETDLKTWESWDDPLTIITSTKPVDPISQKIELYRQQKMAASQESSNEEPKIDYFQDMTPRIVKQTKVLLFPEENEKSNSANLSFAPDPVYNTSELGVWEDSQTWEDQTEQDWDASTMLREKKKQDRERKLIEQQQKKKFDRELRFGKSLSSTKAS